MLLAVLVGSLSAASVQMRDGRLLDGEIVPDLSTDAVLALRVTSGRVSAVLNLPRVEVLELSHEPSQRQQLISGVERRAKRLGSGGSAAEWWELAEKIGSEDPVFRRELAREALRRDRHHAEARAALGFRRVNGIWMEPQEAATARGQVLVGVRWVDWETYLERRDAEDARLAERDALRQDRAARAAAAAEARRARVSYTPAYASFGTTISSPRVLWGGAYGGRVWGGSYRSFGGSCGPRFVQAGGSSFSARVRF